MLLQKAMQDQRLQEEEQVQKGEQSGSNAKSKEQRWKVQMLHGRPLLPCHLRTHRAVEDRGGRSDRRRRTKKSEQVKKERGRRQTRGSYQGPGDHEPKTYSTWPCACEDRKSLQCWTAENPCSAQPQSIISLHATLPCQPRSIAEKPCTAQPGSIPVPNLKYTRGSLRGPTLGYPWVPNHKA